MTFYELQRTPKTPDRKWKKWMGWYGYDDVSGEFFSTVMALLHDENYAIMWIACDGASSVRKGRHVYAAHSWMRRCAESKEGPHPALTLQILDQVEDYVRRAVAQDAAE
jgi:hypothetical protein